MFENIKLEKGMYDLTNKSFTEVLEEADPSENYVGTAYESLDAYERQLKRFDIKLSGRDCDRVEKFFTTTESAVLFPEFVRRAVKAGMESSELEKIVSVATPIVGNKYMGITVSDSVGFDTKGTEGEEMPESKIRESKDITNLSKYCRLVSSSYEAIRQQRIDLFAVILKSIGKKIAGSIFKDAVAELCDSVDATNISGATLAYSDIAALFGSFDVYRMNKLIVTPKTAAIILSMDQMKQNIKTENGSIYLPFGAELVVSGNSDSTKIIGIDSEYALEYAAGSDVILETDKLISRQLDLTGISVNAAFRVIFTDAVKIMNLSK